MSLSTSDQSHWDQEQPFLEEQRKMHPELFEPVEKNPGTLMNRVGISGVQGERPKGYIKYSPLDFIVEEIRLNDAVVTVDGKTATPEYEAGEGTIYVDLTKVGISTLDAVQRIADALKIEVKKIGYAGIKDAVALTSQRISIRGVDRAHVESITVPNCLLRNIVESKGAIGVGNLNGNRFTLFIRTMQTINEQTFTRQIETISQAGIMNYYGVQRFGTPRFLAHLFGMYILRGQYKECVRAYLTKESEFELPFFTNKRREAAAHFGNWQAIKDIFSVLPYTYRFELQMLNALIERPDNYLQAIHAVGEQASLWVRAYASYLTNLYLSESKKQGVKLPPEIPLLLSPELSVDEIYRAWLYEHGVEKYRSVLRDLKFIQVGKNPTIEPVIKPTFHGYKVLPQGVAISFDLTKGAYATTVLEELFDVVTGYPMPEWLKKDEVDTKRELGTGSLDEVKMLLGEAIGKVMSKKESSE